MENEPVDLRIAYAQNLASSLLQKLELKAPRVQDKYEYYNADNDIRDYGISIPKNMINSRPGVGWASRAINSLSDRVVFDGFANDRFSINS